MRIVLADDNESVRLSLAEFLSDTHHEVKVCQNGREALETLKSWPAHAVISDIQMPVMDGISLLKAIKSDEETGHVEVLLFTGYGDVKGAVEAMRLGAYDYILKPVNIRELDIQLKRLADFLELKKEHRELSQHFEEKLKDAREEMVRTMASLNEAYAIQVGMSKIGLFSDKMKALYKRAEKLHNNPDIPVLIEGETGSGKEMLARFVHFGPGNAPQPFVAVNCAALSANLFESELFGYEAGAFTGGLSKGQKGKIELAGKGSLFLDEITEMPVEHQAKLLRVIQEKEYYRVGGLKTSPAPARFICSTNQAVEKMMDEGAFRQDLFYRLSVGHLRIPPLRERPEEILPLADMFLAELRQKKKTDLIEISTEAQAMLTGYHWPGNVRELKNVIEHIALYYEGYTVEIDQVRSALPMMQRSVPPIEHAEAIPPEPEEVVTLPSDGLDLDDYIIDIVQKALEKHDGNQTRTAQYLGISVRKLHTHLKHLEARE